jgi:hypothetical protein
MKSFFQFSLIFLFIFISFIFYERYFQKKESSKISEIIKDDDQIEFLRKDKNKIIKIKENNLVKNLNYEVKLTESGNYEIKAKSSEISYVDNKEIVSMQKVIAIFTDKDNKKVIITSDEAIFDNYTYNTQFKKNIKIVYLDNIISSNFLDFNFTENNIIIYENVVYESIKGIIKADNIKMNLTTKNIDIFMNDINNKVNITVN